MSSDTEIARNFVQTTQRHRDLLYEVELVDLEARRFETDWSLIVWYPNIAAAEEAARREGN